MDLNLAADRPTTATAPRRLPGQGRVLVIEDDESLREIMEVLIAVEGCDARSAADAAAALDLLSRWEPDLILLDFYMPGMDGASFIRAYRERPEPHAPIVVLSGSADAREQVADLGVAGCLDKPFAAEALLAVLDDLVGCS